MNPLTQVKNTQKISAREVAGGVSDAASWHAAYKDSAYVFAGGLPFTLTEGDLLAVFAQYGELVDVNLVRDKATGKSKGFAFLAYEDQRSTTLAVDNLNGATVGGRIMRVDHVSKYKKKEEEDEEEEQRKREERGVCYAFQRGECQRGASCKYSHDEQRNANTGWGRREDSPQRGQKYRQDTQPPFKRPMEDEWREDKYRPREPTRNKCEEREEEHYRPRVSRTDRGREDKGNQDYDKKSSSSKRDRYDADDRNVVADRRSREYDKAERQERHEKQRESKVRRS